MNQADKFAILDAVTRELGGTVTKRADAGDNWVAWQNITVETGAPPPHARTIVALSLHYNTAERRDKSDYLSVSGNWPRDHKGNYVMGRDVQQGYDHSIRVSAAKSAQVAAADIRRRFLPDYVPVYLKAAAVVASRADYAAKVAANWELLAQAVGTTATLDGGFNRDQWRVRSNMPENVSIDYVGDDRIDLKIACTPERAVELLKDERRRAGILAAIVNAGESLA